MDKKNKKRWAWQLPFLIFLIVATVLIIRHQHRMPYQHNTGYVFGTVYNITYQCDSDLKEVIEKRLQEVDEALSPYNEHSVITAINENRDVEVNDMFIDVFTIARNISEDTDGAFDITVAPLVNEWGFGFKKGLETSKIDSLRQLVGYQKVRLKGKKVIKDDPRILLDCSAIAKGYGSDVIARLLRQHDVKNYMVEIGGEIVTCGLNEKRMPWKIGVSKPTENAEEQTNELQTVLNVTDKAMATSGNYRNFYYKDGKKYAHTIDPKTGYPVQHSILSATVLASDCATADAYATAFMVLGMEKTKEILRKHKDLMAYLIYANEKGENAVWFSPSLEDKIAK